MMAALKETKINGAVATERRGSRHFVTIRQNKYPISYQIRDEKLSEGHTTSRGLDKLIFRKQQPDFSS